MAEDIRIITVDGTLIGDREEFFEVVRKQLPCGILMASNLDALHDALTTISSFTTLRILGAEILEANLGRDWPRIHRVIQDSLDENYNLSLEFGEAEL